MRRLRWNPRTPPPSTGAVQLVAAQNGALDGGCGELNAFTLSGEVRRGDAELDLVQPEVAVLTVGLLRPESDGHGFAAVLGCRNEHLVVVDFCAGQVLRHLHADIVDAQRERAALEFLHDLCRAVVGIERRFGQFHGKLRCHGLGKLRRGAVGFFTVVSLGDFCVIKFIQTNGRHCHSSQT